MANCSIRTASRLFLAAWAVVTGAVAATTAATATVAVATWLTRLAVLVEFHRCSGNGITTADSFHHLRGGTRGAV
ncbi:MAG: hypothetical protein AAB339_01235, partial [Elusimicrobiota bacterium]